MRNDNANGYIKEINGDKYLVFDATYENKELITRYDVFNGILDKIRKINDDWLEYAKDYMKIKFSSVIFTIKQTIKILQYDCNHQMCVL